MTNPMTDPMADLIFNIMADLMTDKIVIWGSFAILRCFQPVLLPRPLTCFLPCNDPPHVRALSSFSLKRKKSEHPDMFEHYFTHSVNAFLCKNCLISFFSQVSIVYVPILVVNLKSEWSSLFLLFLCTHPTIVSEYGSDRPWYLAHLKRRPPCGYLQLHVLRREMGFSEITWRGCKVFQAEYGWTVHLWYLRVIENKSKL